MHDSLSPPEQPTSFATPSQPWVSWTLFVMESMPKDIWPLDMMPARNGGGFALA